MTKQNNIPAVQTVAQPAVKLPDTIGTVKMDILGNGETVVTAIYPKHFSTGSLGWFTNGKMILVIDGKAVPCTYQMQVVVIGSKPTA